MAPPLSRNETRSELSIRALNAPLSVTWCWRSFLKTSSAALPAVSFSGIFGLPRSVRGDYSGLVSSDFAVLGLRVLHWLQMHWTPSAVWYHPASSWILSCPIVPNRLFTLLVTIIPSIPVLQI